MNAISFGWLSLMVDVSIKSLLLAALAATALFALRVRDTNLRHRVWTVVLLGMFTMPALVHLTPSIPLPRWMTVAAPTDSVEPAPADDRIVRDSLRISPAGTSDIGQVVYSNDSNTGEFPIRSVAALPHAPNEPRMSADHIASEAGATSIGDVPPKQVRASQSNASRFLLVLAALYLLVFATLVVRLLIGRELARRLVSHARDTGLDAQRLPLHRSMRVLESPQIRVAVTVGFLRPVVLLPASWRLWSKPKLQAVLAHELAHIRRTDWLVVTLTELNRAIYWFHPLAWFIRRRLAELAERNCDDAALEADGDRAQYARHLLEVAGLLKGSDSRYRAPIRGVAMARTPNVQKRIDAILDVGRPLARRLGNLGAIVLLVSGATAVFLTAALRTAAGDSEQKPPAEVKPKPAADAHPNDSTKEAKPGPSVNEHVVVKGRVLGPDGTPVAHATVYAAWAFGSGLLWRGSPSSDPIEHKILSKTQSDAEGNYELSFSLMPPDATRVSAGWQVVAFAVGFGPAWQRDVKVMKNVSANAPTTLVLANDRPIRGRIVDLEGNPLVGVQVRIHTLYAPTGEQAISDWIQEAKKRPHARKLEEYFGSMGGSMEARNSPYAGPFPQQWNDGRLAHGSLALAPDAVTDQDGRVQFNQLGGNRLAILELEGPSIAKCRVHVVTREMDTQSAQPAETTGVRTGTYYGGDFQLIAEPTQPIVGTVTDVQTGDPLADLEINVERIAGNLFQQDDFLSARTDKRGRYRISGAPRGGGHLVKVNPTLEQPYFPTEKKLAAASGFEPIRLDFSLRRGQWIVGKVTDRDSKEPIKSAMVEYLPLRSNARAQDYPNYDPNISGHVPSGRYFTSADGSFRVLAIPGNGIIAAIAEKDDEHTYLSLTKETAPKNLVQADGRPNTYHPWNITGYHAIKEIEVPESNDAAKHDLELTRGLARRVKIVDTQGEAVTGVRVLGRVFPPILERPTSDATIEVIGLRPNDGRDVIFIHEGRKIGKATTISAGNETTVELEPCAVVRGRIVNEEGQPMGDLPINVTVERPDNWHRGLLGATTGQDGRFEILLSPGTTYRLWLYRVKPTRFSVSAECRARAGAVFELGDLSDGAKLSADQTDKLIAKSSGERRSAAEIPGLEDEIEHVTASAQHSKIHGRIAGLDGKPAGGVDVAVIGWRTAIGRGGDLKPNGAVLGETKTDPDGHYQLELTGISSRTHRDANLIARAKASALAWRKVNLNAADVDASFELKPEEPIAVRLVDVDGQQAAGVRVRVDSLMDRAGKGQWPAAFVRIESRVLPAAWPESAFTDSQGRLVIHGVAGNQGVNLEIAGDDRFAPQGISLNTGMAEQRGERDATYRSLVKNLKPREEGVLPLAPAQVFTGTVRYADTGQPAAHARLTIWASQEKFGSMISVPGQADEQGHYKINPKPGIRFGVSAYPPENAPYLVREINDISWNNGARSKVVNVALPRGVLVEGKVIEEGRDSPIAGASVQYIPEDANNSNAKDGILTGWQDIHLTDKEGKFKIAVLPGPGRILVHAPSDEFILQEVSSRELFNGKIGGRRNYAHAIERINPDLSSASKELSLRLKRGATVRGELVDDRGAPIDVATMATRLRIDANVLFWRGLPVEVRGGHFEFSGLAPGQEYQVHFLESKRRLGATLIAKSGMDAPHVVLQPCGAVKMRFVDGKGKPVAQYEPTIQLVVTPGGLEFPKAAMAAGSLAADADFISNVDRPNHASPEASDDGGHLTVSALIPGATYRVITYGPPESVLSKEFKAVTGETTDLGDITAERQD